MVENDTIEYIYEPLSQFKNNFKEKHRVNVEEYFTDLVEKSKVDVSLNKDTVKQIKKLDLEVSNLKKRITKFKLYRILLIFLIIACLIAVVVTIYNSSTKHFNSNNIIIIASSVFAFGLSLFLIIKSLNPKIKRLKNSKDELKLKLDDLIKQAWKQMQPLNELFKESISLELFQKTVPLIKFDEAFNRKRLDYFIQRYGLNGRSNINSSKLYVNSGEINGNPFYISQDLDHKLGTKTYTGSISISWTTTSYVNGKSVKRTQYQTLSASLEKPCPYYAENKYLVYGNEAAPDLSFIRHETDVEDLNEKQIERKVNKSIKRLNKKAEKDIAKGKHYTVLGNSEFEVLFGATNRDHEVQFRLLFTPLAQKELLEIMKEKQYGYGDEFNFQKEKKINYIYPKHLQNFNINIKPNYYYSYDLEEIRLRFNEYNNEYFRQLYFTFAPILAIPLYQQQKPQEYIYKDLYDSYVSFYEHESVVNKMNQSSFIHPLSQTRNILKTNVLKSKNNCDTIKVTSYGYTTQKRVDYISKLGGDGRMHRIPIHWVEYIPVSKDTNVEIKYIEAEDKETYALKTRKFFEDLKNKKVKDEDIIRVGSLFAYIINKENK